MLQFLSCHSFPFDDIFSVAVAPLRPFIRHSLSPLDRLPPSRQSFVHRPVPLHLFGRFLCARRPLARHGHPSQSGEQFLARRKRHSALGFTRQSRDQAICLRPFLA
jgi:hypothetical protein